MERYPTDMSAPNEVISQLLAGVHVTEVCRQVGRLPVYERYRVLCSACSMQSEVATNQPDLAKRIETILSLTCPFHFPYQKCSEPIVETRRLS